MQQEISNAETVNKEDRQEVKLSGGSFSVYSVPLCPLQLLLVSLQPLLGSYCLI